LVGLPAQLWVAKIDVAWIAVEKGFNEEFEKLLYWEMPDVVVIDAYSSLGIPDITRPESGLVLDELRRLANKYDCAMVILHHVNKSGEALGSSLHKAKIDSMISLVNINNTVTLTQEKIRGTKFDEKLIDFNPNTLQMTDAKISLKDKVKQLRIQGLTLKEIQAKFPSAKKDTIRRYY
jgi:RecA-family ATPase